ncbi:glycosyltransferase 87 family protein, partial [Streptomyces sp. NPDC003233]
MPVLAWAVTRTALLLTLFGALRFPGDDVRPDVVVIYHGWYERLLTGSFPVGDVTWQYPPAAAAVFLAPALLPFLTYSHAFYLLACAADATVLVMLLRAGRAHGRDLAGAWLWVAGVAALGPLALARYDVMVTALAVAALLAAARHPRVAGAL